MPRVVVTGIGLVTPLGGDRETSWRRLCAGDRAVRSLEPDECGRLRPSGSPMTGWVGAPAEFDPVNVVDVPPWAVDPVTKMVVGAAREAVEHAGLADFDSRRAGCVIGTSKGGLSAFRRMAAGDDDRFLWEAFLPDAAARAVAADHGLRGPVSCPVAACATGLVAILRGAELIAHGDCDVVVAGSGDASLLDNVVASFRRLGVHASDCEDPAAACRPFDVSRSGFVVGEGAGVVVLESAEHADRRGAEVLARWRGGGRAADVSGLMQIDESGESLARLVSRVLSNAGLEPDEVDHVQLHGTGTVPNDRCEAWALRQVFGERAASLPCSGVKGSVGHLLGAAGSVETAFGLLSIRDGVVPATANLRVRDPDCTIGVTAETRRVPVRHVVSVSLGFGGHLVVGAFSSPDAVGDP